MQVRVERWVIPMKTILIVEDEPTILKIFRISLERLGYVILEAETTNRAFEICETYPSKIDLLIADVILRVATGVQAAERIARARPTISVLFISGYPRLELVSRGLLDAKMSLFSRADFLQKPFMPWVLEEHVRQMIGGSTT